MKAISEAGLTLNPSKCFFGRNEISFWGMIYGADGVKPDPAKVEALDYITPPTRREDLVSFLCMMQSNADFIPNFAKKSAPLRDLTKRQVRFKWTKEHQKNFEELIEAFKKDVLLRYFDMGKPTFVFTDAHITGLGAMLAQGESRTTAKPVAFASRTTSVAEHMYPQLDLEAMGVDFGLRRFRNYLLGSPDVTTVVTDHKPLVGIFNGNRPGSIRTERIKMRHQDIRFRVEYQKGRLNQTDFVSRRAKPWVKVPKNEQDEADDLNNLLYALHTTPVMDSIGLATIAKHTRNDLILNDLTAIVKQGKAWISKKADPKLRKFEQILSEITTTGNGILLKGHRIILPESLQKTAIELAHRGSHPGESGMERRLRYHFFFHDMQKKVKDYIKKCLSCNSFTDKKISEPIKAHEVPSKCWETVAVDLFGPMPSSKHVVVVQDLASRFPAAKLVTSTNSGQVIPALSDIYNAYGNPNNQLSDNGPPFNSKAMKDFARERDINLQNIPPLHPSANPVETFMKPLGKTMKIAHQDRHPDTMALQQLLDNYRDTPHPATGIPPSAMMFRDNQQTIFPRVQVTEEQVQSARKQDEAIKHEREEKINASKYRKSMDVSVGDIVMIRNFNKRSKFDPVFIPEAFKVLEVSKDKRLLIIVRDRDGKTFRRHPDDVKPFKGQFPATCERMSEEEEIKQWQKLFVECTEPFEDSYVSENEQEASTANCGQSQNNNALVVQPRRSTRQRRANPKYYGSDFEN